MLGKISADATNMNAPQTKNNIIASLKTIQDEVNQSITSMSRQQFTQNNQSAWSAQDYLKHLLLSIKPLAKALTLPAEQIQARFGTSDRNSRDYTTLAHAYQARLDEGIRAEDYSNVLPSSYRFPTDVTDQYTYLIQAWDESNNKLIKAIAPWNEHDLDAFQLPHPALNIITIREILFFTIYHNTLHWHDIQRAGGT